MMGFMPGDGTMVDLRPLLRRLVSRARDFVIEVPDNSLNRVSRAG